MTGTRLPGGRMPCAMTFCLHGRHRPKARSPRLDIDAATTLGLALLAASLLFGLAPRLDLWASGLFAAPGGGFPLSSDPTLITLRDLNRALHTWLVAGLLLALLARAATAGRVAERLPRPSTILIILGTYLVGPLGIVQFLKTTVGRARPQDVLPFGGDLPFTAAWRISDACARNCSFSSGEAASAAMLPLFALLLPRRLRAASFAVLCAPAVVFSFNRIAFGSHFLSDVLVSWLLVAVSAVAIARHVAKRAGEIDAAVDGRLRSSFTPGALLRAPDGTLGGHFPRKAPSALRRFGARSSSIREHSEAWLFRATSRRSFSPIPAASTPRSS